MPDRYYDDSLLVEKQPTQSLIIVTIILFSVCYYALGNEWATPLLDVDNFQLDPADVEEQAESGRNIWRLAMFSIGSLGIGLLITPGGRRGKIGNLLSLAMIASVGWIVLSVLWSEIPALTFRRAMGFVCIFIGTLGVAKHFSATHVCMLAVAYGTFVMLVSVATEISHGTFNPLDGSYRFAGTAHPNQTAIRLSVLSICSLALAGRYWKWRPILIPIFICGFGVVFLTKSRSSLAALLLAIGAVWALDSSRMFKLGTIAFCGLMFFLVAAGSLATGVDSLEAFAEMTTMGRDDGDDPSSFTGRVPLWEYAMKDIAENPIFGAGAGSYWSDAQLADAHYELEWALPDAHNAYLEVSLGLGLVGLFLAVATTFIGMASLSRIESREMDRGLGAIFGICTFGLLNGFFESHMLQAFNFTPFIVNCAFCRLAFFPEPTYEVQHHPEIEFQHEDVEWEASLN